MDLSSSSPESDHNALNLATETLSQTRNTGTHYLRRDVRYARRLVSSLSSVTTTDDSRMLAIVSCGPDGHVYLGQAMTRLLRQVEESSGQHSARRLDIIIGRNCGAPLGTALNRIARRKDVEVVHLVADPRKYEDIPAVIRDTTGSQAFISNPRDDDHHRVFVVDQTPSIQGRGKIRMLADVYQLCVSSVMGGAWTPPSTTLSFDAESWFIENTMGETPDLASNGLARMQQQLRQEHLDLVGARWFNCAYEDGLPSLSQSIHPLQVLFNVLHGHEWLRGMPGGGTLGRTIPTLALGRAVASYSGARMEDFMLTVLAHHGGFRWKLDPNSVITNKCAAICDRGVTTSADSIARDQARRWVSGLTGLGAHYGFNALRPVADLGSLREALLPRYSFHRLELENHTADQYTAGMLAAVEAGGAHLLPLIEDAFEQPEDPFGDAHWGLSA